MNFSYVRFINRTESTESSYKFPFKHNSLDSAALKTLDMLPRQNGVWKLTFSLSDLNLLKN